MSMSMRIIIAGFSGAEENGWPPGQGTTDARLYTGEYL